MTYAGLRVEEQLDFVVSQLPRPGLRLLEVGCGQGDLATALTGHGFEVRAIDVDGEAVATARAQGVSAQTQDLLDFDDDAGFDAVIFARSLHHIYPLEAAMERTHALLRPKGVVIVDEFAHDEVEAATAAFFYGARDLLTIAGLIPDVASRPDDGDDPTRRWRVDHLHDPPLHTGGAMVGHLAATFDSLRVERSPYLWMYLGDALETSRRGHAAARALRDLERGLIESRAIRPVGLRVVGRRRGRSAPG